MLIGLAIVVAALAAAPLKFQQLVINSLVDDGTVARLAWLCAGFLAVALLSAALKFALNYRLSVLGEDIVLRSSHHWLRRRSAGRPGLRLHAVLTWRMPSNTELAIEIPTACGRPWGGRTMPSNANALGTLALLVLLAACGEAQEPVAPEVRPVRVVTIEERAAGDAVSLTGTVQAEMEVDLAFRIDGRMTERLVGVGDTVEPGQLVARLNPQNEQNALRAAQADLAAARGQLIEAQNNYERQSTLLRDGWTTRVRYDEARQNLETAQSRADAAQAQLYIAENWLGYTELYADSAGTVTAVGAEPGEVVQAGRMIVQVARQDGRDAVFDVPAQVMDRAPADPEIEVFLTMDPTVKATGRVREVAPRADPVTGTFAVKVGLTDPPAAMRLGSTVTGRMQVGGAGGIEVPASALTQADGQAAVWVVDPASETVSMRNVEVLRHDPARVLVAQGLENGDIVVTAGVQALRPGQQVRLLGESR